MRPPSSPDQPKRPRDPSYPDRARIDSDVRELMRQPSTPWIVFDRDSRVPREELPQSPVATAPTVPMFPLEHAPTEPVIEPSNVVLTTDVMPPEQPFLLAESEIAPPPSVSTRSPRVIIAAAIAGALGVVAMIACVVGAHPGANDSKPAVVAATANVPSPPLPPNLDLPPPPTDDITTPAPGEATTDKTDPKEAAPPSTETDPKKKFGRLTIKGAAVGKQVFMDGKRLLGTGQRTFTVFCGEHTIAVNDKEATRDVNVPCNGELTISR